MNGIEMPHDFNCEKYDKIRKVVHELISPKEPLPDVWIQFSSGWNAIKFRYKAMCYHDETYRVSLKQSGFEGRYVQERELFSFFVNCLSVLETYFYALYFIGKYRDSVLFKDDSRKVTFQLTHMRYMERYPNSVLTKYQKTLFDDKSFKDLKEIRNVLAHRNLPGRTFYLSVGKKEILPDKWMLMDLNIDEKLTGERRIWLSKTLLHAFEVTMAFLMNDI